MTPELATKRLNVTPEMAARVAKRLNVRVEAMGGLRWWMYALNVELEHGKRRGRLTNVTNDNLLETGRIVIAHLLESPTYYQALKPMEQREDAYWRHHRRPKLFNDDVSSQGYMIDDDDDVVETLPSGALNAQSLLNKRGTALSDSFYGGIISFCLIGVCIVAALVLAIGLA